MRQISKNDFDFCETYSPKAANATFEKHMHNCYELYCFLDGNADYIVGDTVYHLQPHDLLLIRPSVYHCLKPLSDAPYHRVVINFTAKHLSETVCGEIETLPTYSRLPPDCLINEYYDHAFDIVDRYRENDAYETIVQYLNQILTELKYTEKSTDRNTSIIHPLLGKIITYIDRNLNRELNVQVLSDKFFISPSWIMHAFREFLNIGTMEYINNKKILYAQQLIESGVPPMTAAEQCSFNNYSTFYMQYKKILGISPMKSKHVK